MRTLPTLPTLPTLYQQFIHLSRYSRWIEEKGRRETWEETVDRYFEFFDDHFADQNIKIPKTVREELRQAVLELEDMPSMRALMTAGEALQRDNTAGYNCAYVAVNKVRVFDEILHVLMCGTGVGFSVEKKYTDRLPTITEQFTNSDTVIMVKDSKEGWAKAYRELVSLLIGGQVPKWDTTRIRPAGARLKTFGGRASGPGPLEELFVFTVATFKRAAGRKLTSIECHDIICKIGEVVVVGGVRRAALISLSDLSDSKMRDAKTGQWWLENPQRALANNSVTYAERPDIGVFMEEWLSLYKSKSGERGIFNRDAARRTISKLGDRRDPNYEWGCNPCCLDGNTLLQTNLGKIPISTIVKNIKDYLVLTYNHKSQEVEYTKIISGGMTRPNAEIIQLQFVTIATSEVITISMTPDHRVWTENRGYIMAKDLLESDNILLISDQLCVYVLYGIQLVKINDTVDTYDIQTVNHNFFANGILVHNSEILLRDKEFCNLSEVIVRSTDTKESLKRKIRVATILGTWQASLTNFPYLSSDWKRNCEEEALLGVSLTGILDNVMMRTLGPELDATLEELKAYAVEVNKEWAKKIGINPSAAITCCKPSGTVSALVNCASGIHAQHNDYYIRTVRADKKDPLCAFMIAKGFPSEPCVLRPDHTVVFSFPMTAQGSITRNDMTAIQHLELWLTYQRHWTEHKPSITVTVREEEWIEVGAWVYKHFDEISGISFLPHTLHTYQQAPYQDCTKEQYDAALAALPTDVDWSGLSAYETEDNTVGSQTFACGPGGSCEVVDLTQ